MLILKKEVSILVFDLNIGGTEKVMVSLANYLSNNNCNVNILMVGKNNYLKKELLPNVTVIAFNKNRIYSSLIDIIKYIRTQKIDCFISNVWPITILTVIAGFFKRSFNKKKLVLVEHCHLEREFSSFSAPFKFFQKISIYVLYRFASKVVAVSDGVKEDLCLNKGVNEEKVVVIHNPVDVNFSIMKYENKAIKAWRAFPGAKFISVGNLKIQKNYSYLIDTLSILKNEGLAFKHLILGEGSQRDALTKQIQCLNLEDDIFLAGSVDQPINLIKEADTLILSSKFEGFGLVIVEALAAGTTVVSTDCQSGPAEILCNGLYGYLGPTNDSKKFAEVINFGYLNKISPNKLLARSKDYSIENVGPKYLNLIDEI